MQAKIYFYSKCGACRNTLAYVEEAGYEPEIIEYLTNPPSKKELTDLLRQMGISPMEALRKKGEVYESLDPANLSPEELIDLMATNPILIQRPIVVTDKGVRLCRPAETVKEIL